MAHWLRDMMPQCG